jgi:hypothetical protein
MKIDEFFELLILNNEKELKKFLVENGKAPKVVAAIRFINQEPEKSNA